MKTKQLICIAMVLIALVAFATGCQTTINDDSSTTGEGTSTTTGTGSPTMLAQDEDTEATESISFSKSSSTTMSQNENSASEVITTTTKKNNSKSSVATSPKSTSPTAPKVTTKNTTAAKKLTTAPQTTKATTKKTVATTANKKPAATTQKSGWNETSIECCWMYIKQAAWIRSKPLSGASTVWGSNGGDWVIASATTDTGYYKVYSWDGQVTMTHGKIDLSTADDVGYIHGDYLDKAKTKATTTQKTYSWSDSQLSELCSYGKQYVTGKSGTEWFDTSKNWSLTSHCWAQPFRITEYSSPDDVKSYIRSTVDGEKGVGHTRFSFYWEKRGDGRFQESIAGGADTQYLFYVFYAS